VVFLKVLAHHGRLDLLRAIREEFDKQYNGLRGRVAVEMRTASPPDEALRREVLERMRRLLEADPQLSVVVDPALVGGVVVTVGDTVFDGSVATRLRQMRAHIIEKNVQHIETNRQRFLQTG
jgi:F-type H+-transporting ATPase subunit delta